MPHDPNLALLIRGAAAAMDPDRIPAPKNRAAHDPAPADAKTRDA